MPSVRAQVKVTVPNADFQSRGFLLHMKTGETESFKQFHFLLLYIDLCNSNLSIILSIKSGTRLIITMFTSVRFG